MTILQNGRRLILLTGATGYIGGRLLTALQGRGEWVRCMARRPEYLQSRVAAGTEVAQGDVLAPETLTPALRGVDTAYYLIHSMEAHGDFEQQDRDAAQNFAVAARAAGVRRIIYLGGLGRGENLSAHLASRQEVGRILRESGVPTIELRASIIIGSGSLSFEMIRSLVDRLPIMTTPRWVRTLAQPIAVEDIIKYLLQSLDLPANDSRVYEIGGGDRVGYQDIMREYARQRGLRRRIISVPALSPRLSSLWLGLVSPLYARIGRKLIEGVRNETIVHDESALRDFSIRPRGIQEAIARALTNEDQAFAATRWCDAAAATTRPSTWGGRRFGSRLIDSREKLASAPPQVVFATICRLGGRNGWYFADWLWRLRGAVDVLFGGVGLRRGRRDPDQLLPGDTLDWWRVETVEPDRLLRLVAEMRLPGRAWLQFEVEPYGKNGSRIRQTAIFDPAGIAGEVYWYAVWPAHQYVFAGMLRAIGKRAESAAERQNLTDGLNSRKE